MDISLYEWIAFIAALAYLLFLPGYNVLRTLGLDRKLRPAELAAYSFGTSVAILAVLSMLVALPFGIGINFYTIVIPETIILVLTNKEVLGFTRGMLKRGG